MRIVYGLSGEGLGHASRALAVLAHLKNSGHEIMVLTYGQAYPVLKKRFKTVKIPGIRLFFKNNKLLLPMTIGKNIPTVLWGLRFFVPLSRKIVSFNPSLLITDMEPITSILSYYNKIPLISIDNQHFITFSRVKIPKECRSSYLLSKYASCVCVPKADLFIILSLARKKLNAINAVSVPPIIGKKVTETKPSEKNFVLVYLTKENHALIKILEKIKENFVVYNHSRRGKFKNLTFKKISDGFLKDLVSSKAVIGSAGFSLISEAIYLKKPYFAVPLIGQFEQTLNALIVKKEGFGNYSNSPTEKKILNFIKKIKIYRKNLKKYRFDANEAFLVLEKAIGEYSK